MTMVASSLPHQPSKNPVYSSQLSDLGCLRSSYKTLLSSRIEPETSCMAVKWLTTAPPWYALCFKWYALYKFTFYLLTYLLTYHHCENRDANVPACVHPEIVLFHCCSVNSCKNSDFHVIYRSLQQRLSTNCSWLKNPFLGVMNILFEFGSGHVLWSEIGLVMFSLICNHCLFPGYEFMVWCKFMWWLIFFISNIVILISVRMFTFFTVSTFLPHEFY